MKVPILGVYIEENENTDPILATDVFQNSPNPFHTQTTIGVNLRRATSLKLEIANLMGQNVKTIDVGFVMSGMNNIELDASMLKPGLYFYTVKAGNASITRKMIVE